MARLAYLGTPALAVGPLRALVEAGHQIALVVSQPDRRRGRGSGLVPSAVKVAAVELGLPVTSRVADVKESGAELGVVVAFGRLIKPDVLAAVPMVNLHFSLLPRWRGAAPVERALLAGDERTGVCLMALDEGLDTGAVYQRAEVPIGPEATLETLRTELVELGASMLVEALAEGPAGLGVAVPQSGEPTYAAKIEPAELHLDWSRPALQLDRVVRLGGAWTTAGGRRLRVLSARPADTGPDGLVPGGVVPDPDGPLVLTGAGVLRLERVQPEGKAPMEAAAWLRGARLPEPALLGT
ncbi:MAG: methionyl-tRNA formyltransferase [Acidimicrobiales bacterium]